MALFEVWWLSWPDHVAALRPLWYAHCG